MLKLELYNETYDKNLTISAGKGLPPVTVNKRSSASVDFAEYQQDVLFLSTLASYVDRKYLRVVISGKAITSKNLEDMKGIGVSALYPGKDASSFITMIDTPDSYSGHAGKLVRVKSDESGLEYVVIDDYVQGINTKVSKSVFKTIKGLFNPSDASKDSSREIDLDKLRSELAISRTAFRVSIGIFVINLLIFSAVLAPRLQY